MLEWKARAEEQIHNLQLGALPPPDDEPLASP